MHQLIKELLLKKLNNPLLKELADSARINYKENIAFTTDSFVVNPLKFPGGDIGKLAVCGTVNDLVMLGAKPEYLSLGLIIEEGLDYNTLEDIVNSISRSAKDAGVYFVTGDLKVVEKGACDKIFINTSGIGRIISKKIISIKNIKPGDSIIVSGNIAAHGLAVLAKRKELDLGLKIKSDCAALGRMLVPIVSNTQAIKFMRDPTRGGLATTLNEIAENSGLGIAIEEKNIPISQAARTACELLGIDPLYLANEGAAIIIADPKGAGDILRMLHKNALGRNARIIGSVVSKHKGKVILKTIVGTQRIVDMLTSEPLPRIC